MSLHDMPPIHYMLMGIAVLIAVFALGALVRFFANTAMRPHFSLQGLVSNQVSSLRFSPVRPILNDAFVVIADITGYTQFLHGSRFTADHAQYLVLQLLDAIAEVSGSSLNFIKIEGDAIVFVCDGKTPEVQGKILDRTIALMVMAFYGRRRSLGLKNTCPCAACRNIDRLDLKMTVDLGPISSFTINEKPDISGLPVIRAFRLLKVKTRHRANIIVTQMAYRFVKMPWREGSEQIEYDLEGVGILQVHYHGFEPEKLILGRSVPLNEKVGFWSVFSGKLKNNFRHLRSSLRWRKKR